MGNGPILIISGTNRPGSNAAKLADLLARHYAAADVSADVLRLTDLPAEAFDPGVYASKPPKVAELQKRVLESSGLHLVVPEYNGSFPGVLKYFVDLLKFPESFENKPVAFVGEAAGVWGGLRAVEQLQQVFGYRNAYCYPDRVFITAVHTKFNGDSLTDTDIDSRLLRQVKGFARYVKTVKSAGEA